MSRPVGVTASATVAILGSIGALLFATLAIGSLFLGTPQPRPPNSAQAAMLGAASFAAFAAIGISTSVGLFRLRAWARTSILIIAVFIAASCIFALLITMAVPLPTGIASATRQTFRLIMGVTFGVPLIISAWWLVEFNRQSTKAAFASPMVAGVSARPLSITVIAVSMLMSTAACVLPLLIRAPVFILGAIFTGWTAVVIYIVLAALSVYIAKGLLDLRERARLLAIAWFTLWFLHASLVTLVPALRRRLDLQAALATRGQASIPFDPRMIINGSLVVTLLIAMAAIWFLRAHRPAFVRAENARDWPGLHG